MTTPTLTHQWHERLCLACGDDDANVVFLLDQGYLDGVDRNRVCPETRKETVCPST